MITEEFVDVECFLANFGNCIDRALERLTNNARVLLGRNHVVQLRDCEVFSYTTKKRQDIDWFDGDNRKATTTSQVVVLYLEETNSAAVCRHGELSYFLQDVTPLFWELIQQFNLPKTYDPEDTSDGNQLDRSKRGESHA